MHSSMNDNLKNLKYFQSSILPSEQNKLVNSRKNTVRGSFKGGFRENTE